MYGDSVTVVLACFSGTSPVLPLYDFFFVPTFFGQNQYLPNVSQLELVRRPSPGRVTSM